MLILGIETSCDETAASLLEVKNNNIQVLSNTISSQIKLHAKFGGVVPSLAAREHIKNLPRVVNMALKEGGKIKIEDVDLISITRGPGLVSSLLVGTAFAQALAYKQNKPIIGTNHLEGHLYSNWLGSCGKDSKIKANDSEIFPALCLIVSGGHTELILMRDHVKYELIGETLDDAAGEAFDKIARLIGLGYPGGPLISALAEKSKENNIKLPRPMIHSKNFDFSFSGLKTSVLYLVKDLQKNKKIDMQTKADIAAETQNAIVDVLVSKTINAAQKFAVRSVMLSGGVSANKRLRDKLQTKVVAKGMKFFRPEIEYTTDNASMIAAAGYFNWAKYKNKKVPQKNAGQFDWKSIEVDANLSLRKEKIS